MAIHFFLLLTWHSAKPCLIGDHSFSFAVQLGERPFVFDAPFPSHHYVAIAFANDETTGAERQAVTQALFASGGRYGLFAGHAYSTWETALDMACIESDPDYQPSDEAFTMTTAQEGESVEEAISFALMNTLFGPHDLDRFLILFVGLRAGLLDELESAIRSVWYDSHMAGPPSESPQLPHCHTPPRCRGAHQKASPASTFGTSPGRCGSGCVVGDVSSNRPHRWCMNGVGRMPASKSPYRSTRRRNRPRLIRPLDHTTQTISTHLLVQYRALG